MVPLSKGEIARAELYRLRATGVRFGTVLADAGYGASAAFRQGLGTRRLLWAVRIPCNQKVCRKPVPDEEPLEAEKSLAGLSWRRITWQQGTRGAWVARFTDAHPRG
jgi:SRSO17 transposase